MKNFFYYLSKTSAEVVHRCNEASQLDRRALGALVFVVACFAFLGGFVLLNTVLGEWDEYSQSYKLTPAATFLCFFIALLYSAMIVLIEREIVSARTKAAVIPRFFLAIIVAVVVSVPLEMFILRDKITEKVQANYNKKNEWFFFKKEQLMESTQQKLDGLDSVIQAYEVKMNQYKEIFEYELTDMAYEKVSGIPGKGPRYRAALHSYNHFANLIQIKMDEKEEIKAELEAQLRDLENDHSRKSIKPQYGLLNRLEAMFQLKNEEDSGVVKWIMYGITALFLFIEITPAFIKLLSPRNEYDSITTYSYMLAEAKLESALRDKNYNMDHDEFMRIPEIRIEK